MLTIIGSASNKGVRDVSSIALACKELSCHGSQETKYKRTLATQPPRTIGDDELYRKQIWFANPSCHIPILLINKCEKGWKLQFSGGECLFDSKTWSTTLDDLGYTPLSVRGAILFPKPTNSFWIKAGRKTYALVLQQLDNEAKLRVAIHERTHRILQDWNYPHRYHK